MKNQGLSYDNIASGFAEMRTEFATEQASIDEFLSHFVSGNHILDVGCGTGTPIANYLISKGLKVTGVDGSKELLAIANNLNPKMKTVLCDARHYNPKECYDGIIEWWCLFHMPVGDQLSMIGKFAQWLNPGGILQFTSGEKSFEGSDSNMLNESLDFYSGDKANYLQAIEKHQFELISCKSDQDNHLVWTVRKPID